VAGEGRRMGCVIVLAPYGSLLAACLLARLAGGCGIPSGLLIGRSNAGCSVCDSNAYVYVRLLLRLRLAGCWLSGHAGELQPIVYVPVC
jgi:hypothetical protein